MQVHSATLQDWQDKTLQRPLEVPLDVQLGLVSRFAKEEPMTDPDGFFWACILPYDDTASEKGSFNLSAPRLCQCDTSDANRIKFFEKTMQDRLVTLLRAGQDSQDQVLACCKLWISKLSKDSETGKDQALASTIARLRTTAVAVLAVAGKDLADMPNGIVDSDAVKALSHKQAATSCLGIVHSALMASQHYKVCELSKSNTLNAPYVPKP